MFFHCQTAGIVFTSSLISPTSYLVLFCRISAKASRIHQEFYQGKFRRKSSARQIHFSFHYRSFAE